MKIVVTGGGSGGHITPILAVARKLKQLDSAHKITYIGQTGDGLLDVVKSDPNIDRVYTVPAGKLRRYSGEGWRQLLDVRSQLLNLRDIFRTLAGVWQSFRLLGRLRPAVIFTRGGFVSVPVALGGRLRRIPYITHDSDSVPSLANRLIAGGAARHAVAMPVEVYPYPATKTVMTGIPINHAYQPVDMASRLEYRTRLGFEQYARMLFITGGGNGARQLNQAVVRSATELLRRYQDLVIVHVSGRSLESETAAAYDSLGLSGADRRRVQVHGFVTDLYRYSGAADVVIARGGATNLAEFAVQGDACIIVPSKQLGWNIKNAQTLADRQAIIQIAEADADQPGRLGQVIIDLLDNPAKLTGLRQNISRLARTDAADELAQLILQTGRSNRVRP